MLSSSSVLAAPLDDYSRAGNGNVSITIMNNDARNVEKTNRATSGISFGNKISFGTEVTIAVAPRWALSLDYSLFNSDRQRIRTVPGNYSWDEKYKLNSINFKVKYQAYKKGRFFVAPYIGVARNQAKLYGDFWNLGGIGNDFKYNYSTKSRISVMGGVTLVYNLDRAGKLSTYFDGSLGYKMYSWNFGVTYKVAKNFSLDVGYKYYEAKLYYHVDEYRGAIHLKGQGDYHMKNKGIYLGLNYNFR